MGEDGVAELDEAAEKGNRGSGGYRGESQQADKIRKRCEKNGETEKRGRVKMEEG